MAGNKTISEKIKELEKATDWFYSDEFELDKAVEKYEETTKLAKDAVETGDTIQTTADQSQRESP